MNSFTWICAFLDFRFFFFFSLIVYVFFYFTFSECFAILFFFSTNK